MRLYKPSSGSGKTGVKSVGVRPTKTTTTHMKISPLNFKVPKEHLIKIK